jgi:eukaryotic-like serine/threonine-protein kinase
MLRLTRGASFTRMLRHPLAWGVGLGLLIPVGAAVYGLWPSGAAAAVTAAGAKAADGRVKVVSRPEGAQIIVDGVARGVSPIELALSAGDHTLQVDNGSINRVLPISVEGGVSTAVYVDLAGSDGKTTGQLEITSDPAGARVMVDGTARGSTPLVLTDIAPGEHAVIISNGDASVTRKVTVAASASASVMASLAPAGATAGWIAIESPIPVEVREEGKVIGAAGAEKILLTAGAHHFELVSPEFGFQTSMNAQVQAGRTTALRVTVPNGSLSINAVPWADVTVDGRGVGTTPIGALSVSVGPHEVVWKHPQFGERRQTIKVTAGGPTRAGMDLSK